MTTTAQTVSNETKLGSFGNGRYSPLMSEIYENSKTVFGLSEKQADKLARNIASEYGATMQGASVGLAKVTIGKVNKEGKVTIKEAATSVKGVTLSNNMFALKALCYAGEAGKSGISFGKTKWVVSDELASYFETL